MKVKIGKTIYDSDTQPIMIILSDKERTLIRDMVHTDPSEKTERFKFLSFPDYYSKEEAKEFMKI